jgi:hypothetical protein
LTPKAACEKITRHLTVDSLIAVDVTACLILTGYLADPSDVLLKQAMVRGFGQTGFQR